MGDGGPMRGIGVRCRTLQLALREHESEPPPAGTVTAFPSLDPCLPPLCVLCGAGANCPPVPPLFCLELGGELSRKVAIKGHLFLT